MTSAQSPAPTALTCTVPTAAGPFTVVVADTAGAPVVLASGWTADVGDLVPLIAAPLRPTALREVRAMPGVTDVVTAYHEGEVHAIDDVTVAQRSGPFLEHAWEVLREVPAGSPVTYTEFAARAGRPAAIRAAGSACSRNAAALFVPCHRVLPVDGLSPRGTVRRVGGFRWGPDVKWWLLRHEAHATGDTQDGFASTV